MPEIPGPDISEAGLSPNINTATAVETAAIEEDAPEAPRRKINKLELEAQKVRAQVLRNYPAMRILLEYVRGDADLYLSVVKVARRRQDFIGKSVRPGELHRGFAALFAGLELDSRARALLDQAIERTVKLQSEWHKEQIRSGNNNYYPELVIGSGPHSQIYNAERTALDPTHPALTVDKEVRIGGQFAQQGPAWALNSRTRPEDVDLEHLPGTAGSLNTLGRGTSQQADFTGVRYATQDTLAEAVRINQLLDSQLMTNAEFYDIELNPDLENGRYTAIFRDRDTGEDLRVRTDRILMASGTGVEIPKLDPNDAETQQILAEEQERYDKTGFAQVMTVGQLTRFWGNPRNTFPLQNLETWAVGGAGDGGRIAVEGATGKIQLGKSVASIDQVKKVYWLSQKADTCQQFNQLNRTRYHETAVEFPRAENPDYPSRVVPIDQKASRLRRRGDKVVVLWNDENGQEQQVEVDVYVNATGFVDTTDKIFAKLNTESISEPDQIDQRLAEAIQTEGTIIGIKSQNIQGYEITKVSQDQSGATKLSYSFVFADGHREPVVGDFTTDQFLTGLRDAKIEVTRLIIPGQVERVPVYASDPESTENRSTVLTDPQEIFDRRNQIISTRGARIKFKPDEVYAEVIINDVDFSETNDRQEPFITLLYRSKSGEPINDEGYVSDFTEFFLNNAVAIQNSVESVELPNSPAAQESQPQPEATSKQEAESNSERLTDAREIFNRRNQIILTPGAIINLKPGRSEITKIEIITIESDEEAEEPRIQFRAIDNNNRVFNQTDSLSNLQFLYLASPSEITLDIASVELPANSKIESQQPEAETTGDIITDAQEIFNRAPQFLLTPGTIIVFKPFPGKTKQLRILSIEENKVNPSRTRIEVEPLSNTGNIGSPESLQFSDLNSFFDDREIIAKNIESVQIPTVQSVETSPESAAENGTRITDPQEILNRTNEILATPGAIINFKPVRRGSEQIRILEVIKIEGATQPDITYQELNRSGQINTRTEPLGRVRFIYLNTLNEIKSDVASIELPTASPQPEAAPSQEQEEQQSEVQVEQDQVLIDPAEILNSRDRILTTPGAIIERSSNNRYVKVRIVDRVESNNGLVYRTELIDKNGTILPRESSLADLQKYLQDIPTITRNVTRVVLPNSPASIENQPSAEAAATIITDPARIFELRRQILTTPGAVLNYKTSAGKVEILENLDSLIRIRQTIANGTTESTVSKSNFLENLFSSSESIRINLNNVELPAQSSTNEEAQSVETAGQKDKLADPTGIFKLREEILGTPGAVVTFRGGQLAKWEITKVDGEKLSFTYYYRNGNISNETFSRSAILETDFRSVLDITNRIESVELPTQTASPETQPLSQIITDQNEISKNRLEITQIPGAIISLRNGTRFEIIDDQTLAANQVRYRNLGNGRDLQPRNRTDFIRQFFDSGQVSQVELPPGVRITGQPNITPSVSEVAPLQTTPETQTQNIEVIPADRIRAEINRIANTNGARIVYKPGSIYSETVFLTTDDDKRQGKIRFKSISSIASNKTRADQLSRSIVFDIPLFVERYLNDNLVNQFDRVELPRESTPPQNPTNPETASTSKDVLRGDEIQSRLDTIVNTNGAVINYNEQSATAKVTILTTPQDAAQGNIRFATQFRNGKTVSGSVFEKTNFINGYLAGSVKEIVDSVELPVERPQSNVAPAEAARPSVDIISRDEIQDRGEAIAVTNGAVIKYGNGDIITILTTPQDDSKGNVRYNLNTQVGLANGDPGTTRTGDRVIFTDDYLYGVIAQSITSIELPRTPTAENAAAQPSAEQAPFRPNRVDTIQGTAILQQLERIATTSGTVINYNDNASVRKITVLTNVLDAANGQVRFVQTLNDGSDTPETTVSKTIFFDRILQGSQPGQPSPYIANVEIPSAIQKSPEQASAAQAETEQKPEISPIGTRIEGHEIYFIGPIANLPLTNEERQRSDALKDINENTAAIFRYETYTRELAKELAQKDQRENARRRQINQMRPQQIQHEQLPALSARAELGQTISYQINRSEIKGLPSDLNSLDSLKTSIANDLYPFLFPESLRNITITLQDNNSTESTVNFNASFTPNVISSPAYQQAFDRLLNDPMFKEIVIRMSQTYRVGLANNNYRGGSVRINIPLEEGRVAIHDITARSF